MKRKLLEISSSIAKMDLTELQKGFSQEILRGEKLGVESLVHAGSLDPARRLQIYTNNVKSTLTASLRAIFSVTEAIVGADCFKFLAKKYISAFPPKQGCIRGLVSIFRISSKLWMNWNDCVICPISR